MSEEPSDRVEEVKPGMYTARYTEEERRELYSISEDEVDEFFENNPSAQAAYRDIQRLKRHSLRYWIRRAGLRLRGLF